MALEVSVDKVISFDLILSINVTEHSGSKNNVIAVSNTIMC